MKTITPREDDADQALAAVGVAPEPASAPAVGLTLKALLDTFLGGRSGAQSAAAGVLRRGDASVRDHDGSGGGLPLPRARMKPAEIEALIAACRTSKNPLLADVVLVAVHLGLRPSELTGLWWEIDLTRDVIMPEASRTSGKSRVVPINADT